MWFLHCCYYNHDLLANACCWQLLLMITILVHLGCSENKVTIPGKDKRPASVSADQSCKRLRKELAIHDYCEGKLWGHEVKNAIQNPSSSWKQKCQYRLVLIRHFWRQTPCYPLCVDASFCSVKWDIKFIELRSSHRQLNLLTPTYWRIKSSRDISELVFNPVQRIRS